MNLVRISRTLCGTALLVLMTAAAALPARAQSDSEKSYPNRVIHIIVGFAAGGGNDIFARVVGKKLQENIGATVVVNALVAEYAERTAGGSRSNKRHLVEAFYETIDASASGRNGRR